MRQQSYRKKWEQYWMKQEFLLKVRNSKDGLKKWNVLFHWAILFWKPVLGLNAEQVILFSYYLYLFCMWKIKLHMMIMSHKNSFLDT